MEYIYRILLDDIKRWVDRREIMAIRGPRQSGKTTLLRMLIEWLQNEHDVSKDRIIYVTFEDRELLDSFTIDPIGFIERYAPEDGKYYFIIDEAQYCNKLGENLKLIYDTKENIKLIVTGSSSLELTAQTGKFLVGRLFEFELMPLNFYEFLIVKDKGLASIFQREQLKLLNLLSGTKTPATKSKGAFIGEMLEYLDEFVSFGGYPEVVKSRSDKEKNIVLKGIVNTYIEKDVLSYLHITDTIKFRKLITLLAASNGTMLKIGDIASQISSYFKEVEKLLNILEQTYVLSLVRPYHKNLVTELRKNPKIYFMDTGLRNYLVSDMNSLGKRQDAGILAENFVLNELRQKVKLNYWRTTSKTEVDFVTNRTDPIPIEVKLSHFQKEVVTKSMHGFLGPYKSRYGIIVTKDFWGQKKIGKSEIKFVPICYI